ncbi:hypothetical protein [Peribacillus frigoritolerans]|nr:hypothetical protein [Peribacillus frigoritolerans]
MTKVFDMIAGIGMLIGIYLFLSNGRETVSIIEAMGKNSIAGIKTLQGRSEGFTWITSATI